MSGETIKCGDCGIETYLPAKCDVCGKPFVVTTGSAGELRVSCPHVPEAVKLAAKKPQGESSRDMVPGFGAAVRARRVKSGLSMHALAEKADTHQTTVSKIENEQRAPSLALALKLAAALGVGIDTIVKDARELTE